MKLESTAGIIPCRAANFGSRYIAYGGEDAHREGPVYVCARLFGQRRAVEKHRLLSFSSRTIAIATLSVS